MIAIWRAHVQTPARDLTIFVQAGGYDEAMSKVLAVANCIVKPAEDAVYNLRSASDLMDDGVSSDRIARLFEKGWSGEVVTHWAQDPVFAVRNPALLMAAWLSAAGPIPETQGDAF